MKLSYLRDNVAFAALLGCFIGIGFMLLIGSGFSENAIKYGTYGITILVSLLASGLALAGVFANLDNQRRLEEERRSRELDAARALLPATLSKLYELTEIGFEACLKIEDLIRDADQATQTMSNIRLSDQTLKNLQDCIRHADGPAKEWLVVIPSYLQMYTARLDGKLFTNGLLIMEGQPEGAALDWLILKSIVSHLFEFSRTGEQPANKLKRELSSGSNFLRHYQSKVFQTAHSSQLKYIDDYGGWTVEGFQSRLSQAHNFPN